MVAEKITEQSARDRKMDRLLALPRKTVLDCVALLRQRSEKVIPSTRHIINAAFTHARPEGSRFNGPDRGAWYAAKSVKTSQAEVSYHHALALSEVGRYKDEISCDEYMADFIGEFHDL
jgi:hypothetical protein